MCIKKGSAVWNKEGFLKEAFFFLRLLLHFSLNVQPFKSGNDACSSAEMGSKTFLTEDTEHRDQL